MLDKAKFIEKTTKYTGGIQSSRKGAEQIKNHIRPHWEAIHSKKSTKEEPHHQTRIQSISITSFSSISIKPLSIVRLLRFIYIFLIKSSRCRLRGILIHLIITRTKHSPFRSWAYLFFFFFLDKRCAADFDPSSIISE